MSKLRCYPPTGGHYGLFIGKDHYEVIVESCAFGIPLPLDIKYFEDGCQAWDEFLRNEDLMETDPNFPAFAVYLISKGQLLAKVWEDEDEIMAERERDAG